MDDSKADQAGTETPEAPVEPQAEAAAETSAEAPADAAPDSGSAGRDAFKAADFQQVEEPSAGNGDARPSIDVILDVPVTLALEVGRTEMSVGRLLELNQGAIVELDRNAGELLDVMVNGTLVARGEIVVINDKFGIRLVDVVTPAKRAAATQ